MSRCLAPPENIIHMHGNALGYENTLNVLYRKGIWTCLVLHANCSRKSRNLPGQRRRRDHPHHFLGITFV